MWRSPRLPVAQTEHLDAAAGSPREQCSGDLGRVRVPRHRSQRRDGLGRHLGAEVEGVQGLGFRVLGLGFRV